MKGKSQWANCSSWPFVCLVWRTSEPGDFFIFLTLLKRPSKGTIFIFSRLLVAANPSFKLAICCGKSIKTISMAQNISSE